ncbi:cupin domain-containing protein [Gabonibacter chumensis]|uniref:cupin domain-containing protein n=1 Tax=Gabonibacter chumensis TaxID=2972474 RepID=UPI0025737A6A|nr:cupin domain-containing protein [Gabonibacter chumensis]MCR9011908.1 cupin domain-containing protein [Gabonibacter chumensis]
MKSTDLHAGILNMGKMIEYADQGIISKQIIKNEAGNITLFSFDKGQDLSEHTAPFDALVQILDGKAKIYIDKKSFILETGEAIIMPANTPHALNAVERFKMLLTMIKG